MSDNNIPAATVLAYKVNFKYMVVQTRSNKMGSEKDEEEFEKREKEIRDREAHAKELEASLAARAREIRAQQDSLDGLIEERAQAMAREYQIEQEKLRLRKAQRDDSKKTAQNPDPQAETSSRDFKHEDHKPFLPANNRKDFSAISLKDCVDIVPSFDGVNPPAIQFVRACKRAGMMGPHLSEVALITMIKTKLTGRALIALEDYYCDYLASFTDRVMQIFAPARSPNYYRGQLANCFQEIGEPVLEYINRIKNLHYMLLEGEERENHGELLPDKKAQIEADTCYSFVDGLSPSLRETILTRDYFNMEDAIDKAIALEKIVVRDQERYGKKSVSTYPTSRPARTNYDKFPPRNEHYAPDRAPPRNSNYQENRLLPTNDYHRGNQYPRNDYPREDRAPYRDFQYARNDRPRDDRAPQRTGQYRDERPSPRDNRHLEQPRFDRDERIPRFENRKCDYCGIPGHIQSECRRRPRENPSGNGYGPTVGRDSTQGPYNTRPVRHTISTISESTPSETEISNPLEEFEMSEDNE